MAVGGSRQVVADVLEVVADVLAERDGAHSETLEGRASRSPQMAIGGSLDLVVLPGRRTSAMGQLAALWRHGRGHAALSHLTGRLLVVGGVVLAVAAAAIGGTLLLEAAAAPTALGRLDVRSVPLSAPATVPGAARRPETGSAGPQAARSPSTGPKSSLPRSAFEVSPPTRPAVGAPEVPARGSSASASTGGLTTAQARAIFEALWSTRSAALAAGDLGQLARVESGAALAGDRAAVASNEAAVVEAGSPLLYVPDAHTYPLSFLAATTPSRGSGGSVDAAHDLVVVFRASPEMPWTISLVVQIPPAAAALAPAGAGGVAVGLATLARAWEQWAATGHAPGGASAPFVAGGGYQAVGQGVAEQVALASLRGLDEHVVFSPSTVPGSTFDAPSTVCGAVDETAVFTASGGGPVLQPGTRSTWGPSVPPGKYRQVTESSVHEVCLASTATGAMVVGGIGAPYTVAATAW